MIVARYRVEVSVRRKVAGIWEGEDVMRVSAQDGRGYGNTYCVDMGIIRKCKGIKDEVEVHAEALREGLLALGSWDMPTYSLEEKPLP